MKSVDDIKAGFRGRLEETETDSQDRLQKDLELLRQAIHGCRTTPGDMVSYLTRLGGGMTAGLGALPPGQTPARMRVELNGSAMLKQIDRAFLSTFHINDYLPAGKLDFPTEYCETLEEFYTPMMAYLDLSPQARQAFLERQVQQAAENASEGGTYGYNLSGKGCYLNGWLFAYGRGIAPHQALQDPELLQRILSTAVHEKLGHGFLAAYSALGKVVSALGLEQIELARRFGLRPADDPLSSLRREQSNLIFDVSQLLEEGWSTWIQGYLGENQAGAAPSRYSLSAVSKAVDELAIASPSELPPHIGDPSSLREILLTALVILFGEGDLNLSDLHKAVMVIDEKGRRLDDYFSRALGQPLRYAVGELLFAQAAANQGAFCQPYTALISASVTFDLEKFGLADLRDLLGRDSRLHPDARLAAMSRIQLEAKGSLDELIQRVEADLSFSIPAELRKS